MLIVVELLLIGVLTVTTKLAFTAYGYPIPWPIAATMAAAAVLAAEKFLDWVRNRTAVLTQQEKRRLAQQARRHGYFRNGTRLSVRCPLCGNTVETQFSQHDGTVIQHLDRAMFAHLDDPDECTPEVR